MATDTLRGLRRPGADGTDALVAEDVPSRVLQAGQMAFKDLAPRGPTNPAEPLSTVIEDVSWCGGELRFPDSFPGEIPTEVATSEALSYYGAKFANRTEERIEVHMEHQQANFTYADNYLDNYVMVATERGGAGGASLERHAFCHTDTPFEDQERSGVFVIGRFLDKLETKIELTGFLIPREETLWVPPGLIHTNNYLKGKWNTMLNKDKPVEEVKLVRGGQNFSFTFREMATAEEKAFGVAKVKFERAKADLRENIEEKETDLIPAAVDKLEKLWSEFDHLLSLKIAGTESEDVDELTKNARKITREKERIISEAKRLIEPEMATGANKRKTVGNGRRIKVARWSDVTEMKSDVLTGKVPPRIVLLGTTGAGKSTLGNLLLGKDVFEVSDEPRSCTEETAVEAGRWCGDGPPFVLVDTPGLNDSEGRDTEHIANIIEKLKDGKFITTFLIVRNGAEQRMNKAYSDMLRIFELGFGVNFWNHVIFDVSFAAHSNAQKQARRWIEEIQGKFPSSRASKMKTVFLDVQDQEEDSFHHNLQVLWNNVSAMEQFECKDMQAVLAQNDQLEEAKREAEEEKRRAEEMLQDETRHFADERKKLEERLEEEKRISEKKREDEARQFAEQKKKLEESLEAEKKQMGREMEEARKRIADKLEEEKKIGSQVRAQLSDKERETDLLKAEIELKKEMEREYEAKIGELKKAIKEAEQKVREKELEVINVRGQARENFEKQRMDLMETHRSEMARKEEVFREEMVKKVEEARKQEKERQELEVKKIEEVKARDLKINQLEAGEGHREKYQRELENLTAKHNSELKEKEEQLRRVEKENIDLQMKIQLQQQRIKAAEDQQEAMKQRESKEKQELEKRVKEEKEEHEKKMQSFLDEAKKSDEQFEANCPALLSINNGSSPGVLLIEAVKKHGASSFQGQYVNVPLKADGEIQNRTGGIAAREFSTKYPRDLPPALRSEMKKAFMLLGMTGTGKTTFIDALINFIFDIRYQDENRLRLVSLTKEEKRKQGQQAQSQTDSIVVYNIKALPGMNIDFDLTIIDSPGFGDTRGVEYDKKLMQNIEDLFKSKKIKSLDGIGFVAKAGDARLTAQQRYIFESVLHIFGKNVKENLLSVLTCYDGHSVNILDSFEEADMNFVDNFPVNSEAMLQPKPYGLAVNKNILMSNPKVVDYQHFFDEAKKLTETLREMTPRPLEQTLNVLHDRECIEVELQGLQENVQRLLVKKENIRRDTEIYKQHEANKDANENSEYEVEEHKVKKVELKPGTYVTNCLKCNVTCHYPCGIPSDSGKAGCAAMRNGNCTVCPEKCRWDKHVNNQHRFEFETKKVKRTYAEMVKRWKEAFKEMVGMETILEALKRESEEVSQEIQASVERIVACQDRLQMNALRTSMGGSTDYFEQLIRAEEHEKKPGYGDRVKQLWEEKEKAEKLSKIAAGDDATSLFSKK